MASQVDYRKAEVYPRINPPLAKWIFDFLFFVLVRRRVIEGAENIPRSCCYLVVSNHLSNTDAYVISRAFPGTWPLAAKVVANPIFRLFIRTLFPLVYLEKRSDAPGREKLISALNALAWATHELHSGRKNILIFPEATRSRTGSLSRPPKGSNRIASVAIDSGCMVVPVALTGTEKLLPIGQAIPGPTKEVKLKIGKPFRLTDCSPQEGVERIMLSIRDLLPQEYQGEYKVQSIEEPLLASHV